MRELNFEEVQEVNGGSDFTDGAALILTGATLAKMAGILGAGVGTAFIGLPLVAAFTVSLVALGGFHIGRGFTNVTIGQDYIGGSERDSDC